jgi:hypothetical protein
MLPSAKKVAFFSCHWWQFGGAVDMLTLPKILR